MGFLDSVRDALRGAVSAKAPKDADAARPADVVDSPAADPVVPAPAAPTEAYTVVVGDSLPEIGARFGASVEEIVRLNGIENPDLIFPGQVFRIPTT